jgi:YcxB-like protein
MVTVERVITQEDYRAFVQFVRQASSNPVTGLLVSLVALVLLYAAIQLSFFALGVPYDVPSAVASGFAVIAWVVIVARASARAFTPDGLVLGRKQLVLADEGIMDRSDLNQSLFQWPAVRRVGVTDRYYFILFDRVMGIIVPRRCFESDADDERFFRELTARAPHAVEKQYDDLPAGR